jgi:hypothetical protein
MTDLVVTPPAATPPAVLEVTPPSQPVLNERDLSTLPDWAKSDLQRLEQRESQLKEVRKEAAAARTRLRQYETEEETRQREAEANRPLEEKLSAAEKARADAEARLSSIEGQAELAQAYAELGTTLTEAGIPEDRLEDATNLLAAHLDKLTEEEIDDFDLEKWLGARPYLGAGGTATEPTPTPPVVRIGSVRNALGNVGLTMKAVEEMTQDEFENNFKGITDGLRRGTLR